MQVLEDVVRFRIGVVNANAECGVWSVEEKTERVTETEFWRQLH